MTDIDPRVIFAAERTLLAWIRTGLSMMGFGFVVARFSLLMQEAGIIPIKVHTPGFSLWIGTGLVGLGVLVNLFAGMSYEKTLKRLQANEPLSIHYWPLGRIVSVILSLTGLIMSVYLILLKG